LFRRGLRQTTLDTSDVNDYADEHHSDDDDADDADAVDDVSDVAHPQTIVNVDSQRHFVDGNINICSCIKGYHTLKRHSWLQQALQQSVGCVNVLIRSMMFPQRNNNSDTKSGLSRESQNRCKKNYEAEPSPRQKV